jgi:hypothetical protein
MLERVDRIQVLVRDPGETAEAWRHILGAEVDREGAVETLCAHRTVLRAGDSEIELLLPTGPGPAADAIGAWGEGLFAAGFAVRDLAAMRERLARSGVRWTEEGEQIFLDAEETGGLRIVLSPLRERDAVGHIRHIYEATHLVPSWKQAMERHTELFGLDPERFSEITSEAFGYTGTLLLFDPPARLDRIELCEITDPSRPMGRFFTRRGPSLYMCYCETDDTGGMVERLKEIGPRYTAPPEEAEPNNLFVHPTALGGVLLGVSRTNWAWTWSGRPELASRR